MYFDLRIFGRTSSEGQHDLTIFVLDNLVTKATMMYKIAAFLAVVASASAFAPASSVGRGATSLFADKVYGKYDGQLWDTPAKDDIYNAWDPSAPRSPLNFNPYETWDGNSPDCSGFYPGENRYKDPARGDINFQIMMEERAAAEIRDANPKPGQVPGCPGCRS